MDIINNVVNSLQIDKSKTAVFFVQENLRKLYQTNSNTKILSSLIDTAIEDCYQRGITCFICDFRGIVDECFINSVLTAQKKHKELKCVLLFIFQSDQKAFLTSKNLKNVDLRKNIFATGYLTTQVKNTTSLSNYVLNTYIERVLNKNCSEVIHCSIHDSVVSRLCKTYGLKETNLYPLCKKDVYPDSPEWLKAYHYLRISKGVNRCATSLKSEKAFYDLLACLHKCNDAYVASPEPKDSAPLFAAMEAVNEYLAAYCVKYVLRDNIKSDHMKDNGIPLPDMSRMLQSLQDGLEYKSLINTLIVVLKNRNAQAAYSNWDALLGVFRFVCREFYFLTIKTIYHQKKQIQFNCNCDDFSDIFGYFVFAPNDEILLPQRITKKLRWIYGDCINITYKMNKLYLHRIFQTERKTSPHFIFEQNKKIVFSHKLFLKAKIRKNSYITIIQENEYIVISSCPWFNQ